MIVKKRKEFKIPDYNLPCPSLNDFQNRQYFYREDGAVFLRGIGNPSAANVMFIASCPLEEDADEDYSYSDPCLLKAESTAAFKRLCLRAGINLDLEYFTTLAKYPLPRSYKLRPKAEDIRYCQDLLEEEIALVKPKIIVCLGKDAATYIIGLNAKLSELEESWLTSQKYKAKVYIIEDCQKSFFKPEYQDKMEKDIMTLVKHYEFLCKGKSYLNNIPQDYTLIDTKAALLKWLSQMAIENNKLFAVDCEWGGMNYVDGTLRSIQFCWAPGKAVFLHFHNEELKWNFDAPKEEIYKIVADYFNNKSIKFLGHNIAADYQWMYKHIGIDIYEDRCWVDTMFGLQTVDEYADLKLEKLAAKYTDLGRYDIDLLLWKKANKGIKFNEDEGYGAIPVDILFPYGCKDVDTTFRMASIVEDALKKDNTWDYYRNIKNPFVTDGFASMSINGIPFDMQAANKIRLSYLICKYAMSDLFKNLMKEEASALIVSNIMKHLDKDDQYKFLLEIYPKVIAAQDYEDALKLLKPLLKTKIKEIIPYLKHFKSVDSFNYLSAQHKQAWLFDVKKYTPIKSTKPAGGNPVEWEKVVAKGLEKQYTPAVDKDTLKVYAMNGDNVCLHILQMSAVETITKTFLKGEEGGLQKFVTSDSRIISNYVLTESSRPRTFKPNILNIPRYVTDNIKQAFNKAYEYFGITKIKNEFDEEVLDYSNAKVDLFNNLVEAFREQYSIEESITIEELKPYEVRSCFKATDGNVILASDFCTAEVFAIAYLANDKALIDMLTKPDYQFAYKKMPNGKSKVVRIAYCDDIVPLTDDAKDPALLHDPNDPDLERDDQGNLKHPSRDVHWSLVESKFFMNTPREKLNKEIHRNSCGKVGNFSVPYGASPKLLERQVELASNQKPAPGTGQKIINAYLGTKPDVAKFLEHCRENIFKGFYQAPSGYKRHFVVPAEDSGLSDYMRDKLISDIQRQACNIPLQNLVADTLARAVVMFGKEVRKQNLKAAVVMPLYDALYVHCPINEIPKVQKIMRKVLSEENGWDLPGGYLRFNLDSDVDSACGVPLSKEQAEHIKQVLADQGEEFHEHGW